LIEEEGPGEVIEVLEEDEVPVDENEFPPGILTIEE
jgi:hypothetical protein